MDTWGNDGSKAYTLTTGYVYVHDPISGEPCEYVTFTDEWGSWSGDVYWQSTTPPWLTNQQRVAACQGELSFGQYYDFYTTDWLGNNPVFSHEDIIYIQINQPNAVPEPSAILLFSTALCLMLWRGRSLLLQRHMRKLS